MKSYMGQTLDRLRENIRNLYVQIQVSPEPPKPFRPCIDDKVVNTMGAVIGYIRGVWMPPKSGTVQHVWVGKKVYRILEWDRSWAAWIAYGRAQ